MASAAIRPYEPRDRQEIRRICGDTAVYGGAAECVAFGRETVVDALLNYYTDHEPESLFVAESAGKAVGYLAGCVDTRRFERVFLKRIMPGLVIRAAFSGSLLHAAGWRIISALARAAFLRQKLLGGIIKTYPAHCHINIAADSQKMGLGSRLFNTFIAHLAARNVSGIHLSTPTEAGKRFFEKLGCEVLARYPAPRLCGESPLEIWIMGKKIHP